MARFTEQLKRHSVALISLTVAITSFAYNTWRNEKSEGNRNVRTAGIELLIKLGDLDRIVLHEQFGQRSTDDEGLPTTMNTRSGWAYVLTVRDLGSVMYEPASTSAKELFEVWQANVDDLGNNDQEAFMTVSDAIDDVRENVILVLETLD